MIFPYRVGRFEFDKSLPTMPTASRDANLSIHYVRYDSADRGLIEDVSAEDAADLVHGLTVLLDMYKDDRRRNER